MTDKEKNKFFRDFILWQQEGLDINEYHCLLINFGANVMFENSQIRRLIIIFSIFINILELYKPFSNNINKLLTYHDIVCSMALEGEVTPSKVLDPFTHTKQDWNKIINFNFIRENSTTDREKVAIEETFCTLVAVGGKYLEKKAFKMVLKKIDEIRKSESIINISHIHINVHLKGQIEISLISFISDHMNRIPLAVFLVMEKGTLYVI